MVVCTLSLVVFSVLGIFSAKHRKLAKEAFECTVSSVKREPCDTGLDDRLQASIVGKVLKYSPTAGKALNNHFKLVSWILVVLLLVSGVFAGQGVYNWAVHGNCNGPNSDEGCAINTAQNAIPFIPDASNNRSTVPMPEDYGEVNAT